MRIILAVAAMFLATLGVAQKVNSSQSTTTVSTAERQRAIALYDQRKFTEARNLLLTVITKNKEDHLAWYYLGFALIQEKKFKEASKAFETSLKLRPKFAAAHSGLGYSFVFRSKWSDAVRATRNALSIDPNLADAHYVMGVARLRTGEHEEALGSSEAAIKIDPSFAPAYLLKSQALTSFLGDALVSDVSELPETRRVRFEQAADALERYLDLDPKSPEKLTWVEQVEALRFYSRPATKSVADRTVFSGKEVTTKARILRKPEPAYTEDARNSGTTGKVVLRAVFSADGSVKHILVLMALPNGLTEASIRAARQIRFIPAAIDGRNVSTFIQLEYNFHLF